MITYIFLSAKMQQPLLEQTNNKVFFITIGGNSDTNTLLQRFPTLLLIKIACRAVEAWGRNQASTFLICPGDHTLQCETHCLPQNIK